MVVSETEKVRWKMLIQPHGFSRGRVVDKQGCCTRRGSRARVKNNHIVCMSAAGSVARHRQIFNFAFFQSIKLNRVHVCAPTVVVTTYCEVYLIVICTLLSPSTTSIFHLANALRCRLRCSVALSWHLHIILVFALLFKNTRRASAASVAVIILFVVSLAGIHTHMHTGRKTVWLCGLPYVLKYVFLCVYVSSVTMCAA